MADTQTTVWFVIVKTKYRDDTFGFVDRDSAYAKAWEIVREIAAEYEMLSEIANEIASDDVWGAWDRVCHGEGELTIDSVEVAGLALASDLDLLKAELTELKEQMEDAASDRRFNDF